MYKRNVWCICLLVRIVCFPDKTSQTLSGKASSPSQVQRTKLFGQQISSEVTEMNIIPETTLKRVVRITHASQVSNIKYLSTPPTMETVL